MAKRLTIKNYNQETRLFNQRIIVTAIIVGLFSFALIARLFTLQLIQHHKYTTLSNKNQMALIPIEPNRGLIFDRNGVLLAENIPSFSLDIVPAAVPSMTNTLKTLQELFQLDDETIKHFKRHRRGHRPFEPVPLKLKLSEAEVALFYVNQYRLPGVMVNARMMRHYPLGEDMVSALGYVGRINEREQQVIDSVNYSASNYIGKLGIERYYEQQLHGTVGYKEVEVNATGQIVRTLKDYQSLPGDNLTLSLDSQVQHAAHLALGDDRGAVVAIKPDNGEVLALVSHPSFDPNLFINGISNKAFHTLQSSSKKPLYNRALRGQYPLASTIKPFLALAALHHHMIAPNSYINDPGYYRIPGNDHTYRDWKGGGHGRVDLNKAITVSCDTFFYVLSRQLGINLIDESLSHFGFGQHSGIDISEELSGLLPTPEWKLRTQHTRWYAGDTVLSSIGQGFMLTTPLQLASGIATIANHGKRFQPHLLKSSRSANGVINNYQPIELPPVVLDEPSYWDIVIRAMQNVIISTHPRGTGYRFGRPTGYTVAAKTGTAEIYRPQQYVDQPETEIPLRYRDHSLFIAFAPIKHPQIAVAVVVENCKDAPKVARKVIDAYLKPTTKTRQHG